MLGRINKISGEQKDVVLPSTQDTGCQYCMQCLVFLLAKMGRVFQEAAKPQSPFPSFPPAQQLEPGSLLVLSHDLIPSPAAGEDAQGASGLVSHGGPKLRIPHSL